MTAGTLFEIEVLGGLMPFVLDELAERRFRSVEVHRDTRARATGSASDATGLRTAVAAYAVEHFDIPRPRALLGHQHLTRLAGALASVAATLRFAGLRVEGAGSSSPDFRRLADALSAEVGLPPDPDDGDLVVRVVRAPGGDGWDALVRLTPRPLSTRPWRVARFRGALNATIAAAMVRMAGPARGPVVNLMCGSGTLMSEWALVHGGAEVTGIDHDPSALDAARANLAAAGVADRCRLVQGDATATGLDHGSAEVVLCDLPYGHAVGSHAANDALYPALLAEAARILAPGGRAVVITHDLRRFESALTAHSPSLVADPPVQVFQKGHHPKIWLIRSK